MNLNNPKEGSHSHRILNLKRVGQHSNQSNLTTQVIYVQGSLSAMTEYGTYCTSTHCCCTSMNGRRGWLALQSSPTAMAFGGCQLWWHIYHDHMHARFVRVCPCGASICMIRSYKVPLRQVPSPSVVSQGHIIVTTGRNDHLFVHTKNTLPGKMMNSHFTRSTSWVHSIAVLSALFGYSMETCPRPIC